MSTLRTIHRTTKFATQNFWRNIWLSVATILVFVLTLVTINILVSVDVLTNSAIDSVEDKIDVSVYFEKGTSETIMFGAQDYLTSLSQVENVEYVSSEEALQRFTERHANDADVLGALDTVETNPFGGSLVVSARNTEDFAFILEALNNPTFGEYIQKKDFSDHEKVIERIRSFTDKIEMAILALVGVFALIAILIVLNSIRVSIYTHREEIGIMKLVGASNSFVRMPYVMEAILFSVIATIVTAAIVLPVTKVLEPQLLSFFEGSGVGLYAHYMQNWYSIFGLQLLGLVILSVLSSLWAMNRYLRV